MKTPENKTTNPQIEPKDEMEKEVELEETFLSERIGRDEEREIDRVR